MLKDAGCMRAHGVPTSVEPSVNSQQVGFNLSGTGINPNAPKVKAVGKTCQPLSPLPGGGP
jgi:hypothetical protein